MGLTDVVGQALPGMEHNAREIEAQVTNPAEGSVLVSVTGAVLLAGEQNPLNFSEVFHLKKAGTGYYVANAIFRILYG